MLTSVKVLLPSGTVAPGEATGKVTWSLLDITAADVNSGGGIF